MSQFEDLSGVITREELLQNTRALDEATPIEYRYGDIRFVMDDNRVTLVDNKNGRAPVILDDISFQRIARDVGLNKYVSKIPVAEYGRLIMPQMNFWYPDSQPDKNLRLLVNNGHALMSIPNANFEHVNVEELITAVEATLGEHNILGYHKPCVGPKSFQFSLLTDHSEMVINDHIYNAGIRVSHSIDGEASTRVEPYLFNQWCTNGCTHEHSIPGWKRRPSGRRDSDGNNATPMMGLSEWLQEAVVDAVMLFDQEIINLQRLAGMPIPETGPEAMDKLLTSSGIPLKLQEAVRDQLGVDGFENMYDVYQAITNVETHSDHYNDHPNARGKLNRMAAHLSHHTTFCPTCSTQMDVYDALEQLNTVSLKQLNTVAEDNVEQGQDDA